MHDIDRTMMEFESEADDYEAEYEDEYDDEDEEAYEGEFDDAEVFDEAEEMELAAELLGVSDDQELDQFLGKLIKKVGRKARKFLKSGTGRALRRILRGAAKKALPIVGGAIGGPVGSRLASTAGRLVGLELEGLSPEDQEFEVAKRVVRLAGDAAKKAAIAQTRMPSATAAKAAVVAAAKKHAPGLVRPVSPAVSIPGGRRSGRWVRRGAKIVLMGV
jgi:hypothetical protein